MRPSKSFPASVFALLFLSLLAAPAVFATIGPPDPQSAAEIMVRNMLDYPGQLASIQTTFGEWIPLDLGRLEKAQGIQGEASTCISLGDFGNDKDFAEDPPGQIIRYVGTGFRDEKLSVICDQGTKLQDLAGSWADDCACASQPATCCLVALTEQDFGKPPPAKRPTWYPPTDSSDSTVPPTTPSAQPPSSSPEAVLDFPLGLILFYVAGIALASAAFYGLFRFGFLKTKEAATIQSKAVLFLVALPFLPWTVFLFLKDFDALISLFAPFIVIGPLLFPLLNILASGWILASQLRVKDKARLPGSALGVLLLTMSTVLWLVMFAFWAIPRAA